MYEEYTDKQIVKMLVPKLKKTIPELNWDEYLKRPDAFSIWNRLISVIYKSGYIRGQLGRSFIIGVKKKSNPKVSFQTGDSVKLINRKGIDNKSNRYFPPIGTIGEVAELGTDYCFVQWPKHLVAGNGVWACPDTYLEKISKRWVPATKDNVKIGSKVRFMNEQLHKKHPQYFPCKGTVGEVRTVCKDGLCDVQWPKGTTSDMDWWVTKWEDLEVLVCE